MVSVAVETIFLFRAHLMELFKDFITRLCHSLRVTFVKRVCDEPSHVQCASSSWQFDLESAGLLDLRWFISSYWWNWFHMSLILFMFINRMFLFVTEKVSSINLEINKIIFLIKQTKKKIKRINLKIKCMKLKLIWNTICQHFIATNYPIWTIHVGVISKREGAHREQASH